MIHHNAFYMFFVNLGSVLLCAYLLDLYATYTDKKDKKTKRTKNVLD